MTYKQNFDALFKKISKKTFFSHRNLKKKLTHCALERKQEICFILGNGPSLTWDLLQSLDGKVTFAFNKIYLMSDASGINWHPSFYMVEDDLVLEQNQPEIISYCKQNPQMVSFFRFYRNSPYENINNLFQYNYVDDENEKFSFEPWRCVVSGQSVVYSAIQIAVSMGFKKIILLGVDFSFGQYDEETSESGVILGAKEQTHFSANYRKENEMWNPPNLKKQKHFFRAAKDVTSQIGVKIIDSTPNGKLNVFNKMTLDEVLNNE